MVCPLWQVFTGNTMIFTLGAHFHMSKPPPQAPGFQFSNLIPFRPLTNQPSHSPLPMRSMYSLSSGSFSFHIQWMARCMTHKLCPLEGLPTLLSFKDAPCGVAVQPWSLFVLLTHTELTYLRTRLGFFSLPSAGYKELPRQPKV